MQNGQVTDRKEICMNGWNTPVYLPKIYSMGVTNQERWVQGKKKL